MQTLVAGIHHFRQHVFPSKVRLFKRLAKGQRPIALLIICSDSRINPNLITHTEPGELFIVRNVGNMVPAYGAGPSGEAAAIEYAVAELGVNDVIVCGHTHCGAMAGILDPKRLAGLPAVRRWLRHGHATARIICENYAHLRSQALLNATAQENVLVQLQHLATHPVVAVRLARRELNLHGWMYKIETGEVFRYAQPDNQFVRIEPVSATQDTAPRAAPHRAKQPA
jgi:carbonic anhydrase